MTNIKKELILKLKVTLRADRLSKDFKESHQKSLQGFNCLLKIVKAL